MKIKHDPLISVKITDAAIAQFWNTRNLTDYLDELEVAKNIAFVKPKENLRPIPKTKTFTLNHELKPH